MTYSEAYVKAVTPQELLDMVRHDVEVCRMYGGNPDRVKEIYDALDAAAKAKGWNASAMRMKLRLEGVL